MKGNNQKIHDLIIIGGGPAGLSAAIYAQRYKLDVMMITQSPGGIAKDAHLIENWPGTISKSGMELMKDFRAHAESYGLKIQTETVVRIDNKDGGFHILNDGNNSYLSRFILLAIGLRRRKLNIPGEDKFLGKGVSYCAACDGLFFRDKVVAVVGGSHSATMTAMLLSEVAKKVYMIYRREMLRGEPVWVERAQCMENIEVIFKSNVVRINGEDTVSSITLDSGEELEIDGIFIEIGSIPSTTLARSLGVELDDSNYICVDSKQETSVERVFAAGDITNASNKFNQIVTAASEGAVAATSIYHEKMRSAKKEY